MLKESTFALVTPEQQRAMIRQITTYDAYVDFVLGRFTDTPGSVYHRMLRWKVHPDQVADYFRLLTLVATQAAQYGYDALHGGVDHHALMGREISYFHPVNLLAQISYLGHINVQAYEKKKPVADALASIDRDLSLKVWQVDMRPKRGVVPGHRLDGPLAAIYNRLELWPVREPIHLPDVELNARLAALRFTPEDADGLIPFEIIMTTVVPRAQEAVGNLLDVKNAVEGFREV